MKDSLKSKIINLIPYSALTLMVIIFLWLIPQVEVLSNFTSNFFAVISPFIAGGIIAYILNMPTRAIERLLKRINIRFIIKKSRMLSVLMLFVIIVLLFTAVLNLIIPAVRTSVALFISEFPTYQQNIANLIAHVSEIELPDFLTEFFEGEGGIIPMLHDFIHNFDFGGFLSSVILGVGGVFSTFFRGFVTLVSSIYFLVEKDRIKGFITRLVAVLIPDKANAFILKYFRKLDFNFHQYVYAQTIDGLILGTLMFIALTVFGSPYALVLALMMGIVNYIPYFGSIFGTAVAVIVVAFSQDLGTAALAAAVMFGIQQLDGNVIQPKLMSESFSVSPLLVIISVTIGGAYGGILGMLVAIPIAAVLKDMLDSFIEYREKGNCGGEDAGI